MTYKKVKKGRSINSIVFHINKKQVADDSSYKLDDPAYIDDKISKTQSICLSFMNQSLKIWKDLNF